MQEPFLNYAKEIQARFRHGVDADPEAQLTEPIERLMREAGGPLARKQVFNPESRVDEIGKPDAAIRVGGQLLGYVELKAPGKGARTERLKGRDQEQWKRFRAIPNIMYSDGIEFALYRSGERVSLAAFDDKLLQKGPRAVSDEACRQIADMFREFYAWAPLPIRKPQELAARLAPLCHLLKSRVADALQRPESELTRVASAWRAALFPNASDDQFADAFAQTLTYALLLARLEGVTSLTNVQAVAIKLKEGHRFLGEALLLLGDKQILDELAPAPELLEQTIEVLDDALVRASGEVWLYFYEHFLAAYDPKLRKDLGVYYTPLEVVRCQVRCIDELLHGQVFHRRLGLADENVILLDPAVGTGTYLLAALERGVQNATAMGAGAVASAATRMAASIHGFETLVGPYTVAHLRLTQTVRGYQGQVPAAGVNLFLTNTLDDPYAEPPALFSILAEEHKRARRVKAETPVLICLGNPPYDREQRESDAPNTIRKGGWVRHGGGDRPPILEDFLRPAREAGHGGHLKNLYNDYVYFWRWAMWKVFELNAGPGIVSFITPSSWLRGQAFLGMREFMRRQVDEVWVLDLEGDSRGPRKTENVFNIQTPVAITFVVRYGASNPEAPARGRYQRVTGTREQKLAFLDRVTSLESLTWEDCQEEWSAPFTPKGAGDYFSWPLLTTLFPWQHSGVQVKRSWPIGETQEVLSERWRGLLSLPDRAVAFRETRDRKIGTDYPNLQTEGRLPPLAKLGKTTPTPRMLRYGYRSFDRHWILADSRVIDYPRPELWNVQGEHQVYFCSKLTHVLSTGPAMTASAEIPDMHYFHGSYGAKDVIPMWMDRAGTIPNIHQGILSRVGEMFQSEVSAVDFFAYVYGVLSCTKYTLRFSEELAIPGPRVPITRDRDLFHEVSRLGRILIWLHTYGNRFVPQDRQIGDLLEGEARNTVAIPQTHEGYPDQYSFAAETKTLHVGAGQFQPVGPAVWAYEVSGLRVLESWLAYRMRRRAGKSSSPLDEIRPAAWSLELTRELLDLLWVLEHTVRFQDQQSVLLDRLVSGPVIEEDELPMPTPVGRVRPRHAAARQPDLY